MGSEMEVVEQRLNTFVRRDVRLLQTANLEEVLSASFQVLNGKRPKQKVQLLGSLKRRRSNGGKYNFLERLSGVAHLLSQMLLDVVCVFNNVSSLSQREQAIKLTQDGFEIFREYFPPKQQVIFLECIWESDKYILVERQNQKDVGSQEKEVGEDVSVEASKVQYESIELFLGGNHEPQFLFTVLFSLSSHSISLR
uniref:Uncharacterized protein n=1 Tax=Solanum tuberosum TaxID=4113 RepID=M1B3C8_SOLTU